MNTTITVDAADLMDATRRASAVAGKRGHAGDVAGGVLFEWQDPKLLVKATDLETTYRCEISGVVDSKIIDSFRLPAKVLSNYLTKLPDYDGKIELSLGGSTVKVTYGSSRAILSRITGDGYPDIDSFDVEEMANVDDLGDRIRQITWACATKGEPPLTGVYVDGNQLVACNKVSLATVQCKVPVDKPLVAPLSAIAAALRGYKGPMGLAVENTRLLLSPNPATQFGSTTYAQEYPNLEPIFARSESNDDVRVDRDELLLTMERVLSLVSTEEYPRMEVFVEGNELELRASVAELGVIEETFEMETALEDRILSVFYNPAMLTDAIRGSKGSIIKLGLPHSKTGFLRITDEHGYSSYLAGLR